VRLLDLGLLRVVRSSDTNDYLRDALGPDFSAKDFRASTATVFAAVGLAVEEDSEGQRQRRTAVQRAARSVAHQLGNTPAAARGSDVDPPG
jgi:DNA topoisomerase-1